MLIHPVHLDCTPIRRARPDLPPARREYFPVTTPNWDDDEDEPDRAEAMHENANLWRRLECGRSHPAFVESDEVDMRVDGIGIGMGFIGSARYNPDYTEDDRLDAGSTVGYMRMICTPWSSTAFVRNWPFLRTMGTSYANTDRDMSTLTRHARGFGTALSDALINIGEWRYDDDTDDENDDRYLRPISMKTCPPNYFLVGIRFNNRTSPDESERFVSGITRLDCALSSAMEGEPGLDPMVSRALDMDPQENSCTFKMGEDDQCFSRSQFIGVPRDLGLPGCDVTPFPEACSEETACPSGEVVGGWRYTRDGSGILMGLELLCIEEPG